MYLHICRSMYVSMYLRIYVCMYVCNVCRYVCRSIFLSLSLSLAVIQRRSLYRYVCLYVCLYVCMHVGMYVRYVCIARTGMISSIYGWIEHKMDNVAVVGGLHRLVANLIISNDPKHQKLVETDGAIFVGRQLVLKSVSRYNWSSCLFQLKPQLVQKTKMSNEITYMCIYTYLYIYISIYTHSQYIYCLISSSYLPFPPPVILNPFAATLAAARCPKKPARMWLHSAPTFTMHSTATILKASIGQHHSSLASTPLQRPFLETTLHI